MKKVYQTIVDKGLGNCMQAVIASLLDLELIEVPNFITFGRKWYAAFNLFLESRNLKLIKTLYSEEDDKEEIIYKHNVSSLKEYEGINGYFFASVCSPHFNPKGHIAGTMHAVVCDHNLNIVHDPNKEYANLKEYPHSNINNGIIDVWVIEKIK